MREIVVDTETTGLNPADGHRIVEIGCVEIINRVKTGRVFHRYINPGRDMPEEAYRIHGLSTEFLRDKPSFESIVAEFNAFIGDAGLVIHNAAFDMRFINAELGGVGHKKMPFGRAVDTLVIARKKFPGAQASLDALCKRFGIDLSRRDKHGALLDADLLADVYVELLGGKQSTLILQDNKEEIRVQSVALPVASKEIRPSRAIPPSEEELAAHGAFLKQLKEPLWVAA